MTLRDLLDRVRNARDLASHACCCRSAASTCEACLGAEASEWGLATWLLDHPETVEAVEVLRAWGLARKATGAFAVGDECRARWVAEDAVAKLADRLAGGGS